MSKYENFALGIDISSNCQALDFKLIKAGNVSFVAARASSGWQLVKGNEYDVANYVDPRFSEYCDLSYKNDLLFLAYHYLKFDEPQAGKPEEDWGYRAFKYAMQNKIPGKSFHAVALDVEDTSNTNTNTRDYLNTFNGWLLHDPQFNGVPILFYTSPGFCAKYPAVRDWLGPKENPKPIWNAQWIASATPTITTTWANLKKFYPTDSYKPQPPGFSSWLIDQWAVHLIGMEGTNNHQIDLNLYNGDVNKLYKDFNYTPHSVTPTPQPGPEPEPKPADLEEWQQAIEARLSALEDFQTRQKAWLSSSPK